MALTDHVLVLAHLNSQVIAGPPTQSYEDVLRSLGVPDPAILLLPDAHRQQRVGAAGASKVTPSALNVQSSGIVLEVGWPCGCGTPLHTHHDFVLPAWARHAGGVEGVDADYLEKHAVAEIDGRWRPDGRPRVVCRCSERFESESYIPDLAAWERHVRQA